MAMLDPKLAILDETDSGLDIDALRIVADGVNALRDADRAILVITHYQRLLELHRARPRPRAVRRPHRRVGRQGARARARGEGLRAGSRARPRPRRGPSRRRRPSPPVRERATRAARRRASPRERTPARPARRGACDALRRAAMDRVRAARLPDPAPRTGGTRTSRRSRARRSPRAAATPAAERSRAVALEARARALGLSTAAAPRLRERPLVRRTARDAARRRVLSDEPRARRSLGARARRASARLASPTATPVRRAEHGVPRGRRARPRAGRTPCSSADPRRSYSSRRSASGRRAPSCRTRARSSSLARDAQRHRRRDVRSASDGAVVHERRDRDRARRGAGARRTTRVQREAATAFHVVVALRVARRATARSRHARRSRSAAALVPQRRRRAPRRRGRQRTLNGLYLARRHASTSTTTRASTTREPHCTSHELYKGILDGTARGVFNGTIYRAPGRPEDRREADEPEPAALGRGARRHASRSSRSSPTT